MNFSFKHVAVPKIKTGVKDPIREDFPFLKRLMRHQLITDKPSSATGKDNSKEQGK